MSKFGLSNKTIDILLEYFSKIPQINEIKIYGSRALGTFRNGSDIDLALFGDIDKESVKKIYYELDELETPYMFDVTNYSTIENKKLKEHIDSFGITFYKK